MRNQKGFSVVDGLLVLVVFGVVGFTGWTVWNKYSGSSPDPKTPSSQVEQQEQDQAETVSITLVSKSSGQPIANTKVSLYSDNGIRCINAPCPTNGKSWEGTTDESGVINVPRDYIQPFTNITPQGYQATALKYDSVKTSYRVTFDL